MPAKKRATTTKRTRKTVSKKKTALVVATHSYHEVAKPVIHLAQTHHSAHVLSLKPIPTPEQILETQWKPEVNLLAHHRPAAVIPDGLTLGNEELKDQLAEDALVPEDIFAYFDLPETEEDPEAELVDLQELTEPAPVLPHPPRPPVPPRPFFSFLPLRAIASFVAVSFVFVLPLHAMNVASQARATALNVESQSKEAATLLQDAANAILERDAAGAARAFALSSEQFSQVSGVLATFNRGVRAILSALPFTRNTYTTGQALIQAGTALAAAGEQITNGFAAMDAQLDPTPLSRLNALRAGFRFALPHLETAAEALAHVDPTQVPATFTKPYAQLTTGLPPLISAIKDLEASAPLLEKLLGGTGTKRYLLVFQNNTELRATGGFIGSFADIKVRNGVIEQMDVPGGGSYDLQGQLSQDRMAPAPLQLLNARWEFQDGNWFPDFPTSARQLIEFYRDAGGPTVDGVIAVNATSIAALMGLLGDVEMPEYGTTINTENFLFETQRIVELEYDRTQNRPKAFIGDLAPKLIDAALEKTSEDFLTVFDFLRTQLSHKEIQLYFTDNTLQRETIARGWAGDVKQPSGDYLMVVDSNLGGGKTDGVIKEEIDVDVDIQNDGSVVNTVTITRSHLGIPGLLFTGVNNVDYLRLYVPKGAELLAAEGFRPPDVSLFDTPDANWLLDDDIAYAALTQTTHEESGTTITQEHGKTVFGNWTQTPPGGTSVARFTYRLPWKMEPGARGLTAAIKSFTGVPQTSEYALTIQKQSGVQDRVTRVRVQVPDHLRPVWSSQSLDALTFDNAQDTSFALLLERR